MKHLFVPYEQALELKNLGFDDSCLAFYDIIYNSISQKYYGNLLLGRSPEYLKSEKKMLYIFGQQKLLAPTFSQAFKFFRDKYNLHYSIHKRNTNTNQTLYSFGGFMGDYFTYEEAELACLIKLIQIVKEKL